jgi:GNAT superfamily N-acetyltransferase
MTDEEIRIEHIKVGELEAFAERVISAAEPGQFVPISMQRARAHAHNPYADPEDVGLLAAIDQDEEVVGYFGILPMRLRVGEELHKTHWFTTWSVSSKVRGKGLGSLLMREALTLEKDFLIVGSVHARRVCRKYEFWERDPLKYYWIDMSGMGSLNPLALFLRLARKIAHVLKIKRTIPVSTAATRRLDGWLGPLTKKVFYPLLSVQVSGWLDGCQFQEVTQLPTDLPEAPNRPAVELYRGVEAVNWMLAYPWIVESGTSPTEGMDYYFSDARPLYRLVALTLRTPGTTSPGFVVFSISEKPGGMAVKILDFRSQEAAQLDAILALAVRYARQYQADTIEVPVEVAARLGGSLLGRLLLVSKSRIYQCHPRTADSPLALAWQQIELHLYDGDMAFS